MTAERVTIMVVAKEAKPITVRLDDDLKKRIEEFQNSQPVAPTMSEIIKVALAQFLERQARKK